MAASRERVVVCGYYGFGNGGDELILTAIVRELRQARPNLAFTVISGNPTETSASHGVEAVHWQDVPAIAAAVDAADLVIVGGGGLFQEYWGIDPDSIFTPRHYGITFYTAPAILGALAGKRVMLYAVGVGPMVSEHGKRFVRAACDAAAAITVRDEASQRILLSYGVPASRVVLTADPAFALVPPARSDRTPRVAEALPGKEGTTVGVALRAWNIGVDPRSWERELATGLDTFLDGRQGQIVFVPFQRSTRLEEDDSAAAERVRSLLRRPGDAVVLPSGLDPAELGQALASCDLVVAMRLHAVILAGLAGVPPVALAYDPKVAEAARQLGVESCLLALPNAERSALAAVLKLALDRCKSIRRTMHARVGRLAQMARRDAATACELLDRADPPEPPRSEALSSVTSEYVKARINSEVRDTADEGPLGTPAAERELTTLLSRHRGVRDIVLLLPSVYWNTPLFQRPNQLALALARQGCLVFFCEPPTTSDFAPGFHPVAERLYVANVPVGTFAVLESPIVFALAYNAAGLAELGDVRVVYEYIDELEVLPGRPDELARAHHELLHTAAVVVATSSSLHERVVPVRPDAVLAPNGVDYRFLRDALAAVSERPSDLVEVVRPGTPMIGYYGALASWFDFDLVAAVADARPGYDFVLIGPDHDGSLATSRVVERPNVHWLGVRPYRSLPAYLKHFDVAIIPFRRTRVTEAVSPIKLFEFMAAHKPVVTSALREALRYPPVLVGVTTEEFVAKLDEALHVASDPGYVEALDRVAAENTWDERATAILRAVDDAGSSLPSLHAQLAQKRARLTSLARAVEEAHRDAAERTRNARRLEEQLEERDLLLSSVRAELVSKVGERDAMIRGLQAELHTKVGERDGLIVALQRRLESELGQRDGMIAALQARLGSEVTERDARIRALQAELEGKVGERDTLIAALQVRLDSEVTERDARIRALQAELHAKVGERDGLIADLQLRLESEVRRRDALIGTLQGEMKAKAEEHYEQLTELRARIESDAAQAARESHELGKRLAESERAAVALSRELGARQQELYAIQTSKWWKAAGIYWRLVELLRGRGERPRGELARGATLERSEEQSAVPREQAQDAATAIQESQLEATAPEVPVPTAGTGRYDVICFPIIDWEFRFQRPQQLMTQFARNGHRVFYLRAGFGGTGAGATVRPLAERVWEVTLPGPAETVIYRDELAGRLLDGALDALGELVVTWDVAGAVSVVQYPFWAPLAFALRERFGWKVVYDCMDDHAGFGTHGPTTLGAEEALLDRSDLVVASSRLLIDKAARHNASNVLVPNAGDFDHFSAAVAREASPIADLARPVVGYYGAIAEWFDVDAVRLAADRHPEWSFVLIGHTFGSRLGDLERRPNVHLLGEHPYLELPLLMAGFDVCTIPFQRFPLTEATNPVKVFEYLATGKPVVATALPELEPLGDVISLYSTPAEFVASLERALAQGCEGGRDARREVARRNTWEMRYRALSARVEALHEKVSVIVISYENLELTKACLESVLADATYPSFDVIVVDNGSHEPVQEYLRDLATHDPRLRIVCNGVNLGFAAANNIGLSNAKDSAFLILLNNDTVVPPGWLARLIRHGRRPEVGLVGPVTNWAGNEARIGVDYTDLAEMPAFARRTVAANAGKIFDINVLAMFCLAMRREVLDRVGPLDERFGVGMFEDDDYARRARALGLRVVCAEDVFVHHEGRASFKKLDGPAYDALFERNRRLFEEKWGEPWVPHSYRGGGT